MAANSKIEWTEQTWNPVVGCSIVSPGCTNCYAMQMSARLEKMNPALKQYHGLTKTVKSKAVWTGKIGIAPDDVLTKPLRRRKPTMYFVNSMSDLFHEDLPDSVIDRVFAVMARCPQHTFQVLTKRSNRMREYINKIALCLMTADVDGDWFKRGFAMPLSGHQKWPIPNVWLGVSTEDQRRADERVPDLLATPAAVRFVSAEPLLGAVDFTKINSGSDWIDALVGNWWVAGGGSLNSYTREFHKIDWIIVGGESGKGARPMDNLWAQSIVNQCKAAGVAVFVKQLSSGGPKAIKDITLFPNGLRVREMPHAKEFSA